MAKQIRVVNFRLLMKFLRKREVKSGEDSLVLELRSDQSGCLRNSVNFEIEESWDELSELNEIITKSLLEETERKKKESFNTNYDSLGGEYKL